MDPIASLLERARYASQVSDRVRDRLLAVTHLLAADSNLVGNATVAACAAELRALCGYTATSTQGSAGTGAAGSADDMRAG